MDRTDRKDPYSPQARYNGEFNATKEESDAWAASPEGREALAQLVNDSVFSGIVKKMQEGK